MNVVAISQSADFPAAQLALIRRTVAADTNEAEFELFIHMARSLRLDPLRRQIYALVYNKNRADKRKMSIIVAIDGFRAIAERTGNYRPDEDEPTFEFDPDAKSPTNPAGLVKATVRVWKHSHGSWHKVTASAWWDEYAPIKEEWVDNEAGQRRPSGKMTLDASGQWGKMPRVMLAKVAEALALRKAWPDDFSALHAQEEVDRAIAIDESAWEAAERGDTERRLERIGQGKTVLLSFDPTAPLEAVPLGKVADRVASFIQDHKDEPSQIGLFESRNRNGLKEFWAHQPGDALEVKKMIERAVSGDEE